MSHLFGFKRHKDSVPRLTVFTLLLSRLLFLRKLYLQWEGTDTSFDIGYSENMHVKRCKFLLQVLLYVYGVS